MDSLPSELQSLIASQLPTQTRGKIELVSKTYQPFAWNGVTTVNGSKEKWWNTCQAYLPAQSMLSILANKRRLALLVPNLRRLAFSDSSGPEALEFSETMKSVLWSAKNLTVLVLYLSEGAGGVVNALAVAQCPVRKLQVFGQMGELYSHIEPASFAAMASTLKHLALMEETAPDDDLGHTAVKQGIVQHLSATLEVLGFTCNELQEFKEMAALKEMFVRTDTETHWFDLDNVHKSIERLKKTAPPSIGVNLVIANNASYFECLFTEAMIGGEEDTVEALVSEHGFDPNKTLPRGGKLPNIRTTHLIEMLLINNVPASTIELALECLPCELGSTMKWMGRSVCFFECVLLAPFHGWAQLATYLFDEKPAGVGLYQVWVDKEAPLVKSGLLPASRSVKAIMTNPKLLCELVSSLSGFDQRLEVRFRCYGLPFKLIEIIPVQFMLQRPHIFGTIDLNSLFFGKPLYAYCTTYVNFNALWRRNVDWKLRSVDGKNAVDDCLEQGKGYLGEILALLPDQHFLSYAQPAIWAALVHSDIFKPLSGAVKSAGRLVELIGVKPICKQLLRLAIHVTLRLPRHGFHDALLTSADKRLSKLAVQCLVEPFDIAELPESISFGIHKYMPTQHLLVSGSFGFVGRTPASLEAIRAELGQSQFFAWLASAKNTAGQDTLAYLLARTDFGDNRQLPAFLKLVRPIIDPKLSTFA